MAEQVDASTTPRPPSGVVELRHTALRVSDLERSLAFYIGGLGLVERHRVFLEDAGITEVFIGGADGAGATLDLLCKHGDPAPQTNDDFLTHITFAVPDAASLADAMVAAGAPETLRAELGDVTVVFLRDPDGHHVELISGARTTLSAAAPR